MGTGAQVIVAALAGAGVEVSSDCPACTTSRSGRRRGDRRSGSSASATSRPRRTRPTATRAPRRARRRARHDRAGRGEHARRGRRGIGVPLAGARDRDRHPDRDAAARRVRGALHETDRPGGDVRARRPRRRLASPAPTRSARRSRRAAALALTAPRRPVYVEIPTDLLSAARRRTSPDRRPYGSSETLAAPDGAAIARAAELLDARRALADLGRRRRARRAGDAVGALAERLAAPVITTYSGRGLLPPDHPLRRRPAAARAGAGGLWDDADCVVAIGTDLDGMTTQNWAHAAAAAPDRDQRRPGRRIEGVRARRAGRGRRRRPPPPSRSGSTRAPAAGHLGRRSMSCAPRRARRSAPPSRRVPRRVRFALPPEATSSATCASRATGWPASTARRRRGACSTRSAGARSAARSRQALGAALAAPGPVVTCPATAASCSPAASSRPRPGADPADRGDRRRRRLRDAPLRPGPRRRPARGRRPGNAGLRAPSPVVRGPARRVEGVGDDFARALAEHVADPAPSVLVTRAAPSPAADHLAALVPRTAAAVTQIFQARRTGRPRPRRRPSAPSAACPRSPSSSTASG